MRNPWRGLGGLPREIWILALASLVNRAGMMVLPMLIIYLTRDLGFTPARAGSILSVYGITAIIAGPVSGALSDRFGPARLMRASLILGGTLILFYPMARSYGSVIAITAAWAAAAELFRPSTMSAITAAVRPEERKSAFALHRLAINLGMSIGPALGGFLAAVSFRMMFTVDGITSIVAGIILLFNNWRQVAAPDEDGSSAAESVFAPKYLAFLLASGLVCVVFFQHLGAMPLFVVGLHHTPAFYGLLFTLNTLLIVAFEVPLTLAIAHWSNRTALILAAVLTAVGFGSFALVSGTIGIVICVIIWTFGEMLLFPALAAHVGDVAPPHRRGAFMGAFSMSMSAALALGPWLGSAIYQHYGSTTVWISMLALGLLSAVLVAFVTPRGPSPSAVSAAGS